MQTRLQFLFAALFMTIGLCGCQHDPNTSLYVTSRPADDAVVGTYRFQSQFVNSSSVIPGSPLIVLHADHTCLTRKKSHCGLLFGYGDPDSGEVMRFERIN
jgi:hypothetical protein